MGGFVKREPRAAREVREIHITVGAHHDAPAVLDKCYLTHGRHVNRPHGFVRICAVLVGTGLPDGPFMRDLPCPGRRSQARPYRFARNTQKIPAASAAGIDISFFACRGLS